MKFGVAWQPHPLRRLEIAAFDGEKEKVLYLTEKMLTNPKYCASALERFLNGDSL